MNVENTTLARKGRINVVYNKQKIIHCILRSEPTGIHTMDIANDTKLHRDTVTRLCKWLQMDDYIFRKNKQSEYHVTKKVYGYPGLAALSFGTKAMRTIYDIRKERVSNPNQFSIDEFCKNLLRTNSNKSIDHAFEANRERESLLEFATRLGAIIVYIMIQALRTKKTFPNREEEQLVDLDGPPIEGKGKDDISRKWVENAIKPTSILFQFCRLPIVKRGLAIFADNDRAGYIDPSLPLQIQLQLIEKRKKMRKMDFDDPYWSSYDMNEENFKKLTNAFANVFPEIHEKLERLRKDLPADIELNIEMAREEKARITQLEKEDPHHTKCAGKLVHDVSKYKDGKI